MQNATSRLEGPREIISSFAWL